MGKKTKNIYEIYEKKLAESNKEVKQLNTKKKSFEVQKKKCDQLEEEINKLFAKIIRPLLIEKGYVSLTDQLNVIQSLPWKNGANQDELPDQSSSEEGREQVESNFIDESLQNNVQY